MHSIVAGTLKHLKKKEMLTAVMLLRYLLAQAVFLRHSCQKNLLGMTT